MPCFLSFFERQNNSAIVKKRLLELRLNFYQAAILGGTGMWQARPKGFSLKKWVRREKALASAGHVHSLIIPEKLIYMQPAGLRWQRLNGATMEINNIANYVNVFACVRFKSLRSI